MKKILYVFLFVSYLAVLILHLIVSDKSYRDNIFVKKNNYEKNHTMIYCYGTKNGIKKEYYISSSTEQYYEKIEDINIWQSINIYNSKEVCFSSSKVVRTDKEIKNSLSCSDYTYEWDFEDRVENLMFYIADKDVAMVEWLECDTTKYERSIFSRYIDKSKRDLASDISKPKELAKGFSR